MINKTILLIDPERKFAVFVAEHLQNYGYKVVIAATETTAFRLLYSQVQPDILLIRKDFPNVGLLRAIRLTQFNDKRIPIILIVSELKIANAVTAFHLGVSDCVASNVDINILVQRIRRCLTALAPEKLKIPLGHSLYLPQDFQILCCNEERIALLPKENELLLLLCNKLNEICTKEEIIQVLWGHKTFAQHSLKEHWSPNLDVLISGLRKKLKKIHNIHIENVKKVGYRLWMLESV